MYGIAELLFGRITGPLDVAALASTLLGVLLMCAALLLLARRNEAGWWLAGASFLLGGFVQMLDLPGFASSSPAGILTFAAGVIIPLVVSVGAAGYGLLQFRRLPRESLSARAVVLRRFNGVDVLLPVAVALVCAVASILVVLAFFAGFSAPLARLPWAALLVPAFLAALLPGALVGLAHRSRWAWLLVVVASASSVYSATMSARGSVLIFLFVAQAVVAVMGWQRWGTLPAEGPGTASVGRVG